MSTIFAYQMTPGDRVNVGNAWVTVLEVTRRDSEWVGNGVVYFRATNGHQYGVDRYHDVERSPECQHDDVEGDDNVPTEYTCRTCGDTWNGGAK